MMGFAEPVIGPATSGRTRWLYPSCELQNFRVTPRLDVIQQSAALRRPPEHLARFERADTAVRAVARDGAWTPFTHCLLNRPVPGFCTEAEKTTHGRSHSLP